MATPLSTYRLQFRPGFGFDEAAAIAPYLAELGVTHVYASPYLQAAPGSTHGYDVVDHSRVNDELGGPQAHARFVAALKANGLGQILDIVPNHMAIPGRQNAWWWDVLKHGHTSEFAKFFDIDWRSPEDKLHNLVLLPVLGSRYGTVLDNGELKIRWVNDEPVVSYYEQDFPLDPATVDEGTDFDSINSDVEKLDELLSRQHFRLAFWRVAEEELDYRRFFDVNSLIALRAEDPEVFSATHHLIAQWLADGTIDGVRVDHIDGLRDPAEYLARLREIAGDKYVIVEKILEHGEVLPNGWPVAGTTGYDTLNQIDGLFVDPDGGISLNVIYREMSQDPWPLVQTAGKSFAAGTLLQSDVNRLTELLSEISQDHRNFRDYTRNELREAIEAILISFPVYRTYVSDKGANESDRKTIAAAIRLAQSQNTNVENELFEFLEQILSLGIKGSKEQALAERFQQLSGPVMAKGVEDTAFYRYFRLASRNEVGGDPSVLATQPNAFHRAMGALNEQWPQTMNASTTHDTKRSEDVRHRINGLSRMPREWSRAVRRWKELNARMRPALIDANTEYLIYQTMVGAHPINAERLAQYLEKATREAKVHTSWTEPNDEYDKAVTDFARGLVESAAFAAELESFLEVLAPIGVHNSLSALAVKLTMPGVPDTYQGTESWAFTLVDPDNRQPVDYAHRRAQLEKAQTLKATEVLEADWESGLIKMFVTNRLLQLRKNRSLAPGSANAALHADGKRSDELFAFMRGEETITIVNRDATLSPADFASTSFRLPAGDWRDVFTDEIYSDLISLPAAFERFPVIVLQKIEMEREES